MWLFLVPEEKGIKKGPLFLKKGIEMGPVLVKKGNHLHNQGSRILFEENIIEPISSFVFRRYLYRITPAQNDQFLQIYLARIFPYKTQNPKQCILSPRPIKTETKKRYCNPVLILRFSTNNLSRGRLGAVCD